MTMEHLGRLRRARDLLSVRGFEARETVLTCFSGAGFDPDLRRAAHGSRHVLLVDLPLLYSDPT